jgi:hypothetical protein
MAFANKNRVQALSLALLLTCHAFAATATNNLDQLTQADRIVFDQIKERNRRLTDNDPEDMARLKEDIDRFTASHPDLVPIMVEARSLEWYRYTIEAGAILASQSVLPWFLEYQKMAPDYPRSYVLAARAYVFTRDFEGALPSLRKAGELAPDDPEVDLAWALLHDRKIEHDAARKAAAKAIPKAKRDPLAMGVAIQVIAKHYGILTPAAASEMAATVCEIRCDSEYIADIVALTMNDYSNEPGLLLTLAHLANLAAKRQAPQPELLLQWARIAQTGGNFHLNQGLVQFEPALMRPAEDVLASIKDIPAIAEKAWGYRFDMALNRGVTGEAINLFERSEGTRVLGRVSREEARCPARSTGGSRRGGRDLCKTRVA